MNSAVLGLKLHVDDLKMNCTRSTTTTTDPLELEIITDVQSSLLTVTNILDSLTIVDHAQNGSLRLIKEEVPVLSFLQECFQSIRSIAREGHIICRFSSTGTGI